MGQQVRKGTLVPGGVLHLVAEQCAPPTESPMETGGGL